MKPAITFVHTSPLHVETFEQLAKDAAPEIATKHVVVAELLACAQSVGADDPDLVARVQGVMTQAAAAGSSIVMCTCSTIGGAAERTPTYDRFRALRVDRAMADAAVLGGPRVLLVATAASTLGPTQRLLDESAAALGRVVEITHLLVPDAWAHFERGDVDAYIRCVAAAVRAAPSSTDVVVLAQASMAPAAEALSDLPVKVLSSPRMGVAAAIRAWRDRTG